MSDPGIIFFIFNFQFTDFTFKLNSPNAQNSRIHIAMKTGHHIRSFDNQERDGKLFSLACLEVFPRNEGLKPQI